MGFADKKGNMEYHQSYSSAKAVYLLSHKHARNQILPLSLCVWLILSPAGLESLMILCCCVCILCCARLPCCFVVKFMSYSDSLPEIVLGHVKCRAMWRQSVIHCARGLSQYASPVIKWLGWQAVTFAEKKDSQRGRELKKKEGLLWEMLSSWKVTALSFWSTVCLTICHNG